MPGQASSCQTANNNLSRWRRALRVASAVGQFHVFGLFASGCLIVSAAAQSSTEIAMLSGSYELKVVQFAVFAGAMSFAILATFWMIRERTKSADKNKALVLSNADMKASQERDAALLNAPDQRILLWSGQDREPALYGALPGLMGAPTKGTNFLAFGTWLTPESAGLFDRAVASLRENAESFDLTISTSRGGVIETQGRTSGAFAFVRFIPLSGERAILANLELEHTRLLDTFDTVQALFEAVKMPIWLRDKTGDLVWANSAYATAVDAKDGVDAVDKNTSLLDKKEREIIEAAHLENKIFESRIPAVVAGDRKILDVVDVRLEHGSAGIATDMNEIELAQSQLNKTVDSHARTLDQLATAVAIFDSARHLKFYNSAFQQLWDLDQGFLHAEPDQDELLNHLRTERKLPEQPDWKKWKEQLFKVYHDVEPSEHWWYLPDGRTLRVFANPHPHGGVTWVFENLTDQLDLESRYNSLIRVQGETLDHLSEAVAVFGSDGRLRLFNPAFQILCGLESTQLDDGAHISTIVEHCDMARGNQQTWGNLQTAITGLSDERGTISGRMSSGEDKFIDYALTPLPNGQSMLTLVDVSATVKVENILVERNEALEQADHLKNAFIEHVSYELRSPLTNIIGFSELLGSPEIGRLSAKQGEYLDHINTSSSSLLAIVNNILDLATVDAGIMQLDLVPIDVNSIITAAREGIDDRMKERDISLEVEVSESVGQLIGDENRIRQVLFNLLSNATTYSPDGSKVLLACDGDDENITFKVTDFGSGLPEEIRASVFNRFESHASSQGRGGAGLGLAIVKSFVELHGGTTELLSGKGEGTTVTCCFPRNPSSISQAAE